MSDLTAAVDRFRKAIQTETLTGQWPTAANAHKDAKEESAKARAALLALLSPARPDGDVTISEAMVEASARAVTPVIWSRKSYASATDGERAYARRLVKTVLAAAHDRPGGEEATA